MSEAGPVAPTGRAITTLRPLGFSDVSFDADGFFGRWWRRTTEATIPHCISELENAGSLDNLRRLRPGDGHARRPPRFSDSDVYKTLEACGWAASAGEFVAETAKLLSDVQAPDGYLNSWVQAGDAERFTDFSHGHEMYCAGHLIQAGIANARTTSDAALLEVGRRFADLLCGQFGDGGTAAVPGHPEIETALVELYRQTGEERHLAQAKLFVDRRGHGFLDTRVTPAEYFQDHRPVRETTAITGHAVRATYLAAGATDVAVETGDRELLSAMETLWADMAGTKAYITGGIGSRHDGEAFGDAYELPPDRAYCESCAAIASIMWSWRLLLATGDGRYADLIERTLYNGFAASTSADGTEYFYVNPLQVRSAEFAAPGRPVRRRPWYGCACCPPNIARLLASLPHYVATSTEAGLQVHQYFAGDIRGNGVRLRLRTGYPWRGDVAIEVTEAPERPFELALRIPPWSAAATIRVNGEGRPAQTVRGYAVLGRTWRPGDDIRLELDLRPRITSPDPRVDAVRGCVALERGPLVYCLEETDQDARPFEDITLGAEQIDETERADLLGGTVLLRAAGLTAIPYFQWANRGPGAMRVWIPEET